MLTFLPLTEIEEMEKAMQGGQYQPNSAQRRLAEEVTRMVHGETGLQQALKATQVRLTTPDGPFTPPPPPPGGRGSWAPLPAGQKT